MRTIYVDGLALVDGHFSGVGQYVNGILTGFDDLIELRRYEQQPAPRVRVLVPRDMTGRFRQFGYKHIEHRTVPCSFRTLIGLWRRNLVPPLDPVYGPGFYLFPNFVDMPLLYNRSTVVVYDLSYELHKEYSDEPNARFLSRGVRRSVERAQRVVAISEHARREIIDFYGVDEDRVVVATPAADQRHFYRRSSDEIARAKIEYGVEGDYILALSNLEPRKNLATLVDAYCALPEHWRSQVALLIVGVTGWKTAELFAHIIEKVQQGYNIMRPSHYVQDHDRAAIISGARMLVYPSHYEGFGMPPLEALACGTPVITADNSSLPEVVGDAGVMLRSDDVDGLREAMLDHLERSGELAERALVEGPRRADRFSWRASAQIIFDAVAGTAA